MSRFYTALVAAILLVSTPPLHARNAGKAVPYQGILNQNGAPVSATLPMVFSLYDAPTGGTQLWTESHPAVEVSGGRFSVQLGNITAFPAQALGANAMYVEVTMDGRTLEGRQVLGANPFSWGGVPAGAVMPFAGARANIPAGWLACDGAAVSRTTYASLFAAIGTAHGSGDGSTTFNLPDYRGRFLRGVAEGQTRDPDRASRSAPAAGGNTGDAVGSVQGVATARPNNAFTTNTTGEHNHSNGNYNQLLQNNNTETPGSLDNSNGEPNVRSSAQLQNAGNHSHTINGGGDSETRPVNAAVTFMIRY